MSRTKKRYHVVSSLATIAIRAGELAREIDIIRANENKVDVLTGEQDDQLGSLAYDLDRTKEILDDLVNSF